MDFSESSLLTLTAHELQGRLATGSVNSVRLVEEYLSQIERHNHNGLELNAIISVCPKNIAIAQARSLDCERKNGRLRSRLHGLPVILKDAIVTDPNLGMATTAGAHAFASLKATRNAPIVDKLVDAGVIILGKGNLTELCGMKNNDTPVGWSGYGGQTLSPYRRSNLNEADQPTCGGSSVGPAVSIAAGFAPLGVGTETGGSNVYPASVNGIYGITMTLGSVPTDGVQKISTSFDRMGLMARCPDDLAALAEVVLTDEASHSLPSGGYLSATRQGFAGLSIGVVETTWGVHDLDKWGCSEIKEIYLRAAKEMETSGARVVFPLDAPKPEILKQGEADMRALAYHEFSDQITKFISNFYPDPRLTNLADLVAWNDSHADEAMPQPHSGQSELLAALSDSMTPATHDLALSTLRQNARDAMEFVMRAHNIEIVVSVSDAELVSFAACSGWPVVTVPLGRTSTNNQPWGLFAMARSGREEVLLRFAKASWETYQSSQEPRDVV